MKIFHNIFNKIAKCICEFYNNNINNNSNLFSVWIYTNKYFS